MRLHVHKLYIPNPHPKKTQLKEPIMRTNLNVPFAQKDRARKLGAQWDAAKKIWYIEDVEDVRPFMQWMAPHLLKRIK